MRVYILGLGGGKKTAWHRCITKRWEILQKHTCSTRPHKYLEMGKKKEKENTSRTIRISLFPPLAKLRTTPSNNVSTQTKQT